MRIVFKKNGREVGYVDVEPDNLEQATVTVPRVFHEDEDMKDLIEGGIRENAFDMHIMGGIVPDSIERYPEAILRWLTILQEDGAFDFTWPDEIPMPREPEHGTVH